MANEPKDFSKELEEEIRKTVSTVATEVGKGLNTAANEIGRSIREAAQSINAPQSGTSGPGQTGQNAPQYKWQGNNVYTYRSHYNYAYGKNVKPKKKVKAPSSGSGTAMGIVGAILGASLLGYSTDMFDSLANAANVSFVARLVMGCVTLVFALISAGFAVVGFTSAARSKRFNRYLTVLGDSGSMSVQDLARGSSVPAQRVRADLRKMTKQGLLREGFYDPHRDMIYQDDGVYQQAQQEEARAQEEKKTEAAPAPKEQELTPAQDILARGNAFLVRLTELEKEIEEENVLAQTDDLRHRTCRILNWLQRHPNEYGRVRRVVSYYLPTVEKLLTTYNEVDDQADHSSVASDIQANIVDVLHSVNDAFEKLENNLLQDTAMDISSEISALETMMAQDGLNEDELNTHLDDHIQ